ncbi:class I SAM-dependent methyltransferase [Hyalangium gracile]|uniref:class I SAM-dependent methyltransferase n=1 Tax=Hyalangium gracile TaxID=394092 RepID=UPI001CC98EDC|nr:class I SAM-dependent methyltransferase [Hyalangium gracile]
MNSQSPAKRLPGQEGAEPSPVVRLPRLNAERIREMSARGAESVRESPVRCPACSGPCANVNFEERWTLFGETYTLVRCADCRTMSTFPLPTPKVLDQVYATFAYQWYADHYPAKFLDSMQRLLELRRERIPLGKRILDFGGGQGYFSAAARLLGYQSETYDPVLGAGRPPAPGSYDTVVSFHVLEHSPDPAGTVELMHRFLKPGGTLVLVVPNGLGEGYEKLGSAWTWAQPPLIHLHHFSEQGLAVLLRQVGFELSRVSFHERWDANRVSDVALAKTFARLDSAWGTTRTRRLVAARNSLLRFGTLMLAQAWSRVTPSSALSELRIIATHRP